MDVQAQTSKPVSELLFLDILRCHEIVHIFRRHIRRSHGLAHHLLNGFGGIGEEQGDQEREAHVGHHMKVGGFCKELGELIAHRPSKNVAAHHDLVIPCAYGLCRRSCYVLLADEQTYRREVLALPHKKR